MFLDEAVRAAETLRDAVAGEVEAARGERALFRTLAAGAIFARASARAAFNGEVARLEGELAGAVARAAAALGVEEVTLEGLAAREPAGAAALSRALGEIRALAGALSELDELNLVLARRALACVRGYCETVAPTPSAYDRRGARAAAAQVAVVSSRV